MNDDAAVGEEALGQPAMTSDGVAERRRAFGEALRQTMAARAITQEELAEKIGMRQGAISNWIVGRSQPEMDVAFGIEEFLEVKPGSLTRHLGYLPPGALKSVATVESAILEDGSLTASEKQMLLGAYRGAMAAKVTRRGRPRQT